MVIFHILDAIFFPSVLFWFVFYGVLVICSFFTGWNSMIFFLFGSPSYNITVTQIRVGTALYDVDFTTLFDSGTSFTYLADPYYSKLARNVRILWHSFLSAYRHALLSKYVLPFLFWQFNLQVNDKRHPSDSRIPFEYCYDMRFDCGFFRLIQTHNVLQLNTFCYFFSMQLTDQMKIQV